MSLKLGLTSRLGTASNLEKDGRYDILMFQVSGPFPNGIVTLSFGQTPRSITGVQKVSQTFAKVLMTVRGSDPFNPNLGTTFLENALNGNFGRNQTEANILISDAVSDAEYQVKSLLSGGDDLASQLREARLINLKVIDQGVVLEVRIVTEEGDQANVAIPFPRTNLQVAFE